MKMQSETEDLPQEPKNYVVEKQVEDLMTQASNLMAKAIKMAQCEHKNTGPKLMNTFAPRMRDQCADCGAWLTI